MKKLSIILLSLCMFLSLNVSAFASETVSDLSTTKEIEVFADFTSEFEGTAAIVYDIDLEWSVTNGTMNIAKSGTYVWDADSHQYTLDGSLSTELKGDSLKPSVSITITNNSNTEVGYDISFMGEDAGTTVDSDTDKSGFLETAAKGIGIADGTSVTFDEDPTVEPGGQAGTVTYDTEISLNNLNVDDETGRKIGTFTVSFS